MVLRITIISAHYLPKRQGQDMTIPGYTTTATTISPFVKVTLSGVAADKGKGKTKVVSNNGFNPEWDETFEFPLVEPQMATLMLRVHSHSRFNGIKALSTTYQGTEYTGSLIAQYALPVCSLRQGYRAVPLLYPDGAPVISSTRAGTSSTSSTGSGAGAGTVDRAYLMCKVDITDVTAWAWCERGMTRMSYALYRATRKSTIKLQSVERMRQARRQYRAAVVVAKALQKMGRNRRTGTV